MEKLKETKFFIFNQNNSGGYYDVDDNVCAKMLIEAFDSDQAISIIKPMIKSQSPSCSCCGSRWSLYDPDYLDLKDLNERGYPVGIYAHYKDAEERWFRLYGEFTRLQEPAWESPYGFRAFVGRIYFNTVEQYAQFISNSYGDTTPAVRIFYLDGTKKEFFKVD